MKEITDLFIDKITFSQSVERIVSENGDTDHLHAAIHVAERHSIDVEEIRKFLTESLQEKIFADASKLGMIKSHYKNEELPI